MPRKVKPAARAVKKNKPDAFESSSDEEFMHSTAQTEGKKGLGIPPFMPHVKHEPADSTVFKFRAPDQLPWTKAYIVKKNPATKRLERTHFTYAQIGTWKEFVPDLADLPKTYRATKHAISNNDAFKQSFHIVIQQELLRNPALIHKVEYSKSQTFEHVLTRVQRHINLERAHMHQEKFKEARDSNGGKYTWRDFKEHIEAKPAKDIASLHTLHREVDSLIQELMPPPLKAPFVAEFDGTNSGEAMHFLFSSKRAIMIAVLKNLAHYNKSNGDGIRAAIIKHESRANRCDANLTKLFDHLKTFPRKPRKDGMPPLEDGDD
jgi:hypothetical protein